MTQFSLYIPQFHTPVEDAARGAPHGCNVSGSANPGRIYVTHLAPGSALINSRGTEHGTLLSQQFRMQAPEREKKRITFVPSMVSTPN